jgi:hypothetical protein
MPGGKAIVIPRGVSNLIPLLETSLQLAESLTAEPFFDWISESISR